jgi:molecular chaperone DnaK
MATNKEQRITIKVSSGLSDKEVERMVKEAQEMGEKDKQTRALAEVKNNAEHICYTTEKTLKQFKDKISDSEKSDIESAIEELKKVKDQDDIEAIKKAIDKLTDKSHALAQRMYEETAKKSNASESHSKSSGSSKSKDKDKNSSGDDNIIDAEYETKK